MIDLVPSIVRTLVAAATFSAVGVAAHAQGVSGDV
jgi:hypothetical protein